MNTTQPTQNNENDFVAEIKKMGNNVSGIFHSMKRGLRAASVTKICPNDKDAMKRILAED